MVKATINKKLKIGLYNLEPKIVNSAMMKVSSYHKNKGDKVEQYNHLEQYDKVYKKDKYQRKFARWVNHKAIWKSVKWRDFK